MGFLQSIILSAMALAAIPILIHLLFKRKSRVQPFSTLQFLKTLESKRIRNVKLQQILLLILRTVILALLVLAFARPVLTTGGGSGHERTSVIIVLDSSPSTSYQGRHGLVWDAIRTKAIELLNILGPDDEVILLSANELRRNEHVEWTQDKARCIDKLSQWSVGQGAAKFQEVLLAARRLMESSRYLNREIYVLTDMQRNGFAISDTPQEWISGIRTVFVNMEPFEAEQASVRDVKVASRLIEKDKPVELDVRFSNSGRDRDLLANVYVESQRVAQASMTLSADDEVTHRFPFTPSHAGYLRGYVEIDDDPLMVDNRRYFVLHVPESIHVLLVGEKLSDTDYLALALQPTPTTNQNLDVRRISAAQLGTIRFADFDVVFLTGLSQFTESISRNTEELFQRGGALIVSPGEKSDFQSYNRHLLGRYQLGQVTAWQQLPSSFVEFGQIDYSHPLLRGLFAKPEEARIESPKFRRFFRLTGGGRAMIRLSNGDPFLLEKTIHQGLLLFMTSSLDLDATDFMLRSVFAPLMVRCVRYGYGHASAEGRETELGGSARIPLRDAILGSPTLEDQDGTQVSPAVEVVGSRTLLVVPPDAVPGAYRILDNGRPVDAIALNVKSDESNLQQAGDAEISKLFANFEFEEVTAHDDLAHHVLQARVGFEMWRVILIGVLILLVIESMISQSHRLRDAIEKSAG